ncbi:MAG: hypothetical protein WD314_02155 [Trueperaceae bacterium]
MIDATPRTAEAYLGPCRFGQSRPQLFLVENIGKCAVKFQQNPQGERALTNELVGFGVAGALGIEHPRVGLVEVGADVLPHDGGLFVQDDDGRQIRFQPGMHFYSQWLEPVNRVGPEDLLGMTVQNPHMFAGVVVLDTLLDNWDRKPANLNLLLHRERDRQYLKLIDLGMAFGGSLWTIGNFRDPSLLPLTVPLRYADVLPQYLSAIRVEQDFERYLPKLSNVTHEAVRALLDLVPDAWQITEEERSSLLRFIIQRVEALPRYFEQRLQKEVWWQ